MTMPKYSYVDAVHSNYHTYFYMKNNISRISHEYLRNDILYTRGAFRLY